MRRIEPIWVLAAALALLVFAPPAVGQDGTIEVEGFSAAEADVAQGVSIVGPTQAQPGDNVSLRLVGTPSIDLAEPLLPQLDWLVGEFRMYVYVAKPGEPLESLTVRGELVFGGEGVSMQPLVRFVPIQPGEYRLLVDWNFGQDQLVEHLVAVSGDDKPDPQPDPDPDPNPDPQPPPPVPLTDLFLLILEERDDAMESGAEGVELGFHIKEVIQYCRSLPKLRMMLLDDDTDKAKDDGYVGYLAEKGISERPVIVLRDVPKSRLVQAIPFGRDAAETIRRLKDAGVKQ